MVWHLETCKVTEEKSLGSGSDINTVIQNRIQKRCGSGTLLSNSTAATYPQRCSGWPLSCRGRGHQVTKQSFRKSENIAGSAGSLPAQPGQSAQISSAQINRFMMHDILGKKCFYFIIEAAVMVSGNYKIAVR